MMLVLLILMLCSIGIPNYIHYRRHGAVRANQRDAAVDLLEDEDRDERVPNQRRAARRNTAGLNQYQIQSIRLSSVSQDMQQSLVDECCSICLDNFNEGVEVRTLNQCGHVFH